MISVSGLNKTYATREGAPIYALSDVNLEIAQGEFVTVVGPSGCGKTTLLKILAGILEKSSGSILVNGSPVDRPSRQLGVVFKEPLLLPWRNILQNIMVPVEVQGLDRAVFDASAKQLLRLVGLEGSDRNIQGNCPVACSNGSALPGLSFTIPTSF